MAEYLLKGGKMLARTCPACSSPLFEIKGETFCVVCKEDETRQQADTGRSETGKLPGGGELLHPERFEMEKSRSSLGGAFEQTIRVLLRKAEAEEDTSRLNALMQAVKTAAESYSILSHEYGRRDNS